MSIEPDNGKKKTCVRSRTIIVSL